MLDNMRQHATNLPSSSFVCYASRCTSVKYYKSIKEYRKFVHIDVIPGLPRYRIAFATQGFDLRLLLYSLVAGAIVEPILGI